MKQATLKWELERMLAKLKDTYEPTRDVRESMVAWLLHTAREAGFGVASAPKIDEDGSRLAFGALEYAMIEPLVLEVKLWRNVEKERFQWNHSYSKFRDFCVEFRTRGGETLMASGSAAELSLAIIHTVRSLAQEAEKEEDDSNSTTD